MNNIITINNTDFVLKQSLKALMKFEEITGRNAFQAKDNLTDVMTMFYCLLAININFHYSLDEFIEIVDEQPELLEQFTAYMLELAQQQKADLKKKTVKK